MMATLQGSKFVIYLGLLLGLSVCCKSISAVDSEYYDDGEGIYSETLGDRIKSLGYWDGDKIVSHPSAKSKSPRFMGNEEKFSLAVNNPGQSTFQPSMNEGPIERQHLPLVEDRPRERQHLPLVNDRPREIEYYPAVNEGSRERQHLPLVEDRPRERQHLPLVEDRPIERQHLPAVNDRPREIEYYPAVNKQGEREYYLTKHRAQEDLTNSKDDDDLGYLGEDEEEEEEEEDTELQRKRNLAEQNKNGKLDHTDVKNHVNGLDKPTTKINTSTVRPTAQVGVAVREGKKPWQTSSKNAANGKTNRAHSIDLMRIEQLEYHRMKTLPNVIQCLADFFSIITGQTIDFSPKCCVLDVFHLICKIKPPTMRPPIPDKTSPKPATTSTSTTTTTTTTTTTSAPTKAKKTVKPKPTAATPTKATTTTEEPSYEYEFERLGNSRRLV